MKKQTLTDAVLEAHRFIRAANVLLAEMTLQEGQEFTSTLPRESGAVRRASMDLTRKLADLRQGR